MTVEVPPRKAKKFIVTKEHKRFAEFANAVRRERYIGICYGPAGVGKTLSARRYTQWDKAEHLLTGWGPRDPSDSLIYDALNRSRAVFYTPPVRVGLCEFRKEVLLMIGRVDICVAQAQPDHTASITAKIKRYVELLIIDEAERLSAITLEYVRDLFDRTGIGLILIGMPGFEKRLSRYPQLYSRVGFAHHYRPLRSDELAFVLSNHWKKLGLHLDQADFTDNQAIASVARITGGNFRLVQRLFVQINRIMKINQLTAITDDVVEAARSTLVIGAT